jgi:archaellum component FlaC
MEARLKEQEGEIEVLKEMVKGSKMQLKSKDTDIQRLNIKIKRLDKNVEQIRESTIREVTEKLNSGQAVNS